MRIRQATSEDVIAVAEVHVTAFPKFFLTTMGRRFLRELYSGFLNHSSGILLVAEEAGAVVGFVAGTSSPNIFFPAIRKRRGLYFLVSALPALFRNPIVVARKLYSAVFYRGDSPVNLENGALLSSIAVVPEALGKGVGRDLLEQFELEMCSRSAGFVYLTTDQVGNDRVNAFYRKCGYHEDSRFFQQARRAMLRYVKSISK